MINKVYYKNGLNPELIFLQRLGRELYKHGYFIAGGSIWCAYRGLPINDIDVFSLSTQTRSPIELSEVLGKSAKALNYSYKDSRGVLTKFTNTIDCRINEIDRKVQFVNPSKDRVGTPNDVIRNFDLLNCACYISESGEVKVQNRYNTGPRTKHAVLTSNVFVIGKVASVSHTLKRAMKYAERGVNLNTLNTSELLTIQKAIFLEQLINEDFTEYLEDYAGVTEEHIGFTFTEAQEYLRNNVQDYVKTPNIHNMQDLRVTLPGMLDW